MAFVDREEEVKGWSVSEVAAYLAGEAGVGQDVADLLKAQGINGRKLFSLNSEDQLVEMGIKGQEARRLVLQAVKGFGAIQGGKAVDPHKGIEEEVGFGLCGRHSLVMNLYCEACGVPVCSICARDEEAHKGHKTVSPSERVVVLKDELEGFAAQLGLQSSHVEKVFDFFTLSFR